VPAIRLRKISISRGPSAESRDFAVHGRAPEHKIVLRVIPGSGKEFPRKDYANAESLQRRGLVRATEVVA